MMLIALSTMMLTTACSSEDDALNNTANTENTINKGYALPVTVNVTREGDAGTRATFDGSKLAFSAGDKLFVRGYYDGWIKSFAGTLDYDAESGKFKGTIYTQDDTYKTYEDLFGHSVKPTATLLPAGYEGHGYLFINTQGTEEKYDDLLLTRNEYTLATSKADGVAQFSYEKSSSYSNGFALSPDNAILNFTITGLAASTSVNVSLTSLAYNITGTVTTDASGNATFAAGIESAAEINPLTLTVGGKEITITSTNTVFDAGKIYNITRGTGATVDLSTKDANYTAQNGETLTGTLASNVKISIDNGATVILNNVTINGTNDSKWAGITCLGDATIILSGTNTVKGFYEDYPGIQVPVDKTLTIQGTGSLNASSNGYGAGIGGGYAISCGNIVIKSGTIIANGCGGGSGIGMGTNALTCGTITISGGNITANGGNNGAGIGSGSGGSCGAITISGGNITATGGQYGAGIGSGRNDGFGASCGTITISGGTVSATGGDNAAGIGSGYTEGPGASSCGTITITSGVTSVTATKGSGAPNSIGAGKGSSPITVNIEDPSKVTQN